MGAHQAGTTVMSERGRGSRPHEDDPNGEDAGAERERRDASRPPTSARPIMPYDPYRPLSGETLRRPRDTADPYAAGLSSSRVGGSDVFLPDDDPLNAEAWQAELDEEVMVEEFDAPLQSGERVAPPRRTRRRATSSRGEREPATSTRRTSRRARTSGSGDRGRGAPSMSALAMPRIVTGSPLVADQAALLLIAVNGISVIVMVLMLAVRLGGMPSPIVLQLDAAGNPDLWGPPSVLWRLPLMAFFIMVMAVVVAWFLHPIDRFAARFALGSAIAAQVIAWAAVLQHLG
jgi:hypothetical protein